MANSDTVKGREFIAIGPFAWGRGATAEIALKNMRKNIPSFVKKGRKSFQVWEVDPDTRVGGMGELNYPMDKPAPILVQEFTAKAEKKVS